MVYGSADIACLHSERKKNAEKQLACMAFVNVCLLLIRLCSICYLSFSCNTNI